MLYVMHNAQQGHQVLMRAWEWAKPMLIAGHKLELRVTQAKRSLEANAKLWAMLSDVSRQVEWYGRRLVAEDWKHIFSASLRKLSVVPNLDGTGFVALGLSTSTMTKAEFADLIELINAFGAERGVVWSDDAKQ